MEFQLKLEEELGNGAEDENLIVFKNLRLSDVVNFSTVDKKYVGRVVELSFPPSRQNCSRYPLHKKIYVKLLK